MELINRLPIIEEVDEKNIDEILLKVGSLSFVKDIGVTKENVANYFGVSLRTIEKYMKDNRDELRIYGETVFSSKQFVTDKFLGGKLSKKTRNIALLNKKHILFLACILVNSSETAKAIVKYLLELEELASNDLKAIALERSMGDVSDIDDLRKKIEILQSKLTEVQPLIEFAQIVRNSDTEISINDFAKSTYDKFKLGRNKIFAFMREERIIDRKNMPMHHYIQRGYLKFKMRTLGGEMKYQPLVTGKGQLWLFDRINKKMEVIQ